VSERQPLIRPGAANEVWSADFVFDRVASGRTLKCLVIVDDATHEAIAVILEHCMGGDHLTRVLDGICSQRGKPAVIRTDNGAEFCVCMSTGSRASHTLDRSSSRGVVSTTRRDPKESPAG
jgi:transposase InsO family protein